MATKIQIQIGNVETMYVGDKVVFQEEELVKDNEQSCCPHEPEEGELHEAHKNGASEA